MYQYFMGRYSNLKTKQPNTPTVIEVKSDTSHMIQHWLDKHEVDFDEWVNAIVSILHSEIQEIALEDTQLFQLTMENGKEAFIELCNGNFPKCRLKNGKEEFNYFLRNGLLMEKCIQVKNQIHFGANATENKIMIGKKPVFISIELDRFNEKFYNCVKKYIDALESWEIIAKVMEWIHSLPVEVNTYNLTIVVINEKLMGMQKVFVDSNQAISYIHINPTGQFQVNIDKTWSAEYSGIQYQYNLYERKVMIHLPRGVKVNVEDYYRYFSYVLELIGIMFGTLHRINQGFSKIEEGRN